MRKMKCRAVAGLLSLAMVIPMFPASMAALAEPIEPTDAATQDQLPLELSSTAFNAVLFAGTPWPVKMHVNQDTTGKPDGTGELPTVTVEVNGVLDESNKLTGFAEVALRIKPGVLYYDKADTTHTPLTGKDAADALVASGGEVITEIQPFSTVAVALEYSSKLIPWEWDKLDGNWQKRDEAVDPAEAVDLSTTIDKGLSQEGMVEIPVLHKKTRIAQGKVSAFADKGPKGNNDGVEGNDGGYLFLSAEGFTADDFNEEDTVTVVARFKYDLDQNDDN